MKYSIIVPVYKDPALTNCLAGFRQLNFSNTDYEIIIVENGEKTDWIEHATRQFGYQYIYSETAGSYHARNLGMQAAQGDIFAFTDSDCVVDPDWLKELDAAFMQSTVAGLMGYTRGATTTSQIAQYEQRMYEANIAGFTGETQLRRIDTRNFALRRSVYEKIGGFLDDIRFGGDMEYGARAHQAGFKLIYNAKVCATHANIEQLHVLLQKRVKQNAANLALLTKHNAVFIQTYFPQLLRYRPGLAAYLWLAIYGLAYVKLWLVSPLLCQLLPTTAGYWLFKVSNVVAIRFGMLKAVVQSPV
ncbi:MAG: hypothetical protein ACD_43C00261G0003 [uncultured bacterium]|nr:MAG: hypothetical protein ACD_43C00261G0003 [uncultured bacterium]